MEIQSIHQVTAQTHSLLVQVHLLHTLTSVNLLSQFIVKTFTLVTNTTKQDTLTPSWNKVTQTVMLVLRSLVVLTGITQMKWDIHLVMVCPIQHSNKRLRMLNTMLPQTHMMSKLKLRILAMSMANLQFKFMSTLHSQISIKAMA